MGGRCALPGPSQQRASGAVRLSALHPGLRHLQPCLSADARRARVHAAAGPAADRRLHAGTLAGAVRRREHPQGDCGRARLGRRRGGQRHARAGPADPRHRRARPRRHKPVVLGGPSASASPEMYPDIDYLHIGEMGDATDRIIALSRPERGAAAGADAVRDHGAAAAAGLSDPRLRPHPAPELPDADAAVLERLSLSLRVLRHPQPLRPAAAAQDAAADHRRARRHACPARASAGGLFRRRQLHRQPQGHQGHAAASGRLAEGARLSPAVRLRGDAQHRQAAGDPRADARGLVPRPVRRHRDAGGGCAQGHAQEPEHGRADDGVDQDAERLRPGGDLRHHPRARHRFRRHREAAQGLHRHLADPDADHQPAAGAAEDAAVGPAREGGPDRERPDAGEQRALPASVRRGGGDVAALHRLRQRSGAAVLALPPPGRLRPTSTG